MAEKYSFSKGLMNLLFVDCWSTFLKMFINVELIFIIIQIIGVFQNLSPLFFYRNRDLNGILNPERWNTLWYELFGLKFTCKYF